MTNPTRRQSRHVRRSARMAELTPRLGTIRYGIKPVDVVSADELESIHQASLWILREVGIDFRDSEALKQWKAAGADVRGEQVHLEVAMIESLLALAPERFETTGRGEDTRIEIGVDTVFFCPMQGAPKYS